MIDRPAYLDQIRPFIGKNIIKVLVGARRSGKSTLLQLIANQLRAEGVPERNMLHLNFESDSCAGLTDAASLSVYVHDRVANADGKVRLFLDEIQEVDHWEKAVRSFMVDYDADIYLTGSNARMLSSDLATYITGRYVTIDVYPFSFAEFLDAYRTSAGDIDERAAFRRYVTQGGFPFLTDLSFNEQASEQYLNDLFATILFKDVVRHAGIRDADALERVIRYVLAEEGHLITLANIAAYMKSEHRKITSDTIAGYLNAAAKAFLIYRVPREDAIGKRTLKVNEKYYVVDQGLRQAIGLNNANAIDQVLEGIVCMELKRRGYDVQVGKVGDKEVDFIARKGGDVEYYQVTYLTGSQQTIDREFGAFAGLDDNWPKTVLSMDEFPQTRDGIRGENIIDWLLGR
ncbi:ATP-binding protein [Bifidobacterium amazonense]|uniref:ATP-binding protein n=1 Tax=Bifidobacterium amazonense TaxID=2809027 RepID=A0ABS9VXR3_9BIFI|nr:ATP-binding protein [Bifidobacterium amazonense]MCH9276711.1 ATP-binding protein [Bifidobacterium amazonense]